MRPMIMLTISTLFVASVAGPAAAADMFLKLGPVKGEEAAARKGHQGTIEVLSWQFGAARKGWDGTIKGGSVSERHNASGQHIASATIGGSARAPAVWTPVATPVDQGSVRIKVKFPWVACSIGAKLPTATLESPAERVTFADLSVTRCAADEVQLDYATVVVRGWDPKKKED